MNTIAKYAAVALLSFRQRLAERAVLWGRVLFYFIILLIYARLWQAVLGEPAPSGAERAASGSPGAARYVWYLAMTEWIVLAPPAIWQDIEADVRAGDVAYQLTRPMSYAGARIAEGLGDLAMRMLVLGPFGVCFARWLGGGWPSSEGLAWLLLIGPLAGTVLLLAHVAIGMCAFWFHDCTSIYLIWQKLTFLLGGLMLPLSIYPEWLRTVASYSPFSALIYGPGSLVQTPDPGRALHLLLDITLWAIPILCGVLVLERRGRRVIDIHGG